VDAQAEIGIVNVQEEFAVHSAQPFEARPSNHHESATDDGYPRRLEQGSLVKKVQALEIRVIGKKSPQPRHFHETPPRGQKLPAPSSLLSPVRELQPPTHDPCIRLPIEYIENPAEGVRRQAAIGIDEDKMIAARRLSGKIATRSVTQVGAGLDNADPRIGLR
jgi:hypothetical protein